MAKRKRKSSSRKTKSKAVAKSPVQKKERKANDKTWGDYIGMALSPLLIMMMVGCLMLFFVEAFYESGYKRRLQYTLAAFTLAAVLVSRISILMGGKRAGFYGGALALVTCMGIVTFVTNPLPAIIFIGIIWWCTKKMTWDCTLINEEEDASGEGLLQVTGFEKRLEPLGKRVPLWKRIFLNKSEREDQPHAPGLWILYFSFAAVPVFGLGQFLIQTDGADGVGAAKRFFSFDLLILYIGAALSLLLMTSLLGLRRYLKQRSVEMPTKMVATWVVFGLGIIVMLLGVGYMLPRPSLLSEFGPMTAFSDLKMGSELRNKDSFFAWDYATDRDDPDVDPNLLIDVPLEEEEKEEEKPKEEPPPPKVAASEEKPEEPKEDIPPEQLPPEEKKETPPEEIELAKVDPPEEEKPEEEKHEEIKPEELELKPEEELEKEEEKPEPETELAQTEPPTPEETEENPPEEEEKPEEQEEPEEKLAETNWMLWLWILLAILVGLALNWKYGKPFRSKIKALWNKLFGRKKEEEEPQEEETIFALLKTEPAAPRQSFDRYNNPFVDGSAKDQTNSQVVCYTYDALESWAHEHEEERDPNQTPIEFCYDLERKHDRFESSAKKLSRWYTSFAYAEREPEDDCREALEQVWEVMHAPPQIVEEIIEEEFEVVEDDGSDEVDEIETAEIPTLEEKQD